MESGLERAAWAAAELNGWTDAVVIALEDLTPQGPSGPPLLAVDVEGTFGVDDAKDIAALVGAGRTVRVVTSSPPPSSVTGWLPTNEHVIVAQSPDEASPAEVDEDIDPKVALEHFGRAEAERRGWMDAQIISPADLDSQGPSGSPLIVACEATELTVEGAQAIAALRGTGRAVLIVTNDQLHPPLLDWLPTDAIHVIDDPFQPSATEPQVEHVTEQLNDGRHVESWRRDGALHREDGPAVTITGFMGKVDVQEWHENGLLHRLDGPARITYWPSGDVQSSEWYEHGRRHRLGAPAVVNLQRNGAVVSSAWYFDDAEVAPGYQPAPAGLEGAEASDSVLVNESPDVSEWAGVSLSTGSFLDQMHLALNGPAMDAWQRFLKVRHVTVLDQGQGTGLSAGQWRLNDTVPAVVWFQPLRSRLDHREYVVLRSTIAVVTDASAPILDEGSWWQTGFVEHVLSWCEQPEGAAMIGRVMGFGTGLAVIGRSGPAQCFPSAGANDIRRVLAIGDGRRMPLVVNSQLVEIDCGIGARSLDFAYCVAASADFDSFQDSLEQAIDSLVRVQRLLTDPYSSLEGRREARLGDELTRFMDRSRMTAQGTLATAHATS